MAEYKAEEILTIEVGSEFVTKSKPFKVKAKLHEALPGMVAGISRLTKLMVAGILLKRWE